MSSKKRPEPNGMSVRDFCRMLIFAYLGSDVSVIDAEEWIESIFPGLSTAELMQLLSLHVSDKIVTEWRENLTQVKPLWFYPN